MCDIALKSAQEYCSHQSASWKRIKYCDKDAFRENWGQFTFKFIWILFWLKLVGHFQDRGHNHAVEWLFHAGRCNADHIPRTKTALKITTKPGWGKFSDCNFAKNASTRKKCKLVNVVNVLSMCAQALWNILLVQQPPWEIWWAKP